MLSSLSPARMRLSTEVSLLRERPYLNYSPARTCSHVHPDNDLKSLKDTWKGPRGYGARHILDKAPFTLWDEGNLDFRNPSRAESHWIFTEFHATRVNITFPVLVIETPCPPKSLPLTVAGVAASFLAPTSEPDNQHESLYDARPLMLTTNYIAMRGHEDPLHFQFRKWIQPSNEELQSLLIALNRFCHPRFISILCPYIIVELYCDDERTYEPSSMPRRMGGFAINYRHQQESAFEGVSLQSRERLINPTATVQDTTNYLRTPEGLCPGVRVSSGMVNDVGEYATYSMSTTAGVLLRDSHGHQKLTVANHGFLHTDNVFHPSETGTHIGQIDERWEHLDVALVRLNPSITFSNSTYFEAQVPRRLLRSSEVIEGSWFAIDGMSTGVIFMQAQGTALQIPPRSNLPGPCTEIEYRRMMIVRAFGTSGAEGPREGICGAAMVEYDVDDGGVAGFFQFGNSDFAFAPCLDEVIDRSWSVC